MPRLFYYAAALILGAVWHVAWLISLMPNMPSVRLRFPEPVDLLDPAILLMCAVSLTLALAFRRYIIRADTLSRALATAIGLPLVGTVLYAIVVFAPSVNTGSVSALLHSISMLPLIGVLYGLPFVAAGFWIFFPMGLVSQLVMGIVGRGKVSSADGRLFLIASTSVAAAVAYAAAFVPFR